MEAQAQASRAMREEQGVGLGSSTGRLGCLMQEAKPPWAQRCMSLLGQCSANGATMVPDARHMVDLLWGPGWGDKVT